MNFETHFKSKMASEGFTPDAGQNALAEQFRRIGTSITKPRFIPFSRPPKGLYIYGGVGRGKTMMMDLFYESVPLSNAQKSRAHFHAFMLDVHAQLHHMGDQQDPLMKIADRIAKKIRLLCFDEFHVHDIADAMILKTLFERLFQKGVTLIATSNVAPDDLYRDGLQRAKFVPFIDVLKSYCDIFCLDTDQDYRLTKQGAERNPYITPHSTPALESWFLHLTDGREGEATTLDVDGRALRIKKNHDSVAWVTFAELCEQPKGTRDYQALTQKYDAVLIERVPRFGYDRRNETKRFIHLVDILYEADVFCVFSADQAPHDLYRDGQYAQEFQRTISRLIEMQSKV